MSTSQISQEVCTISENMRISQISSRALADTTMSSSSRTFSTARPLGIEDVSLSTINIDSDCEGPHVFDTNRRKWMPLFDCINQEVQICLSQSASCAEQIGNVPVDIASRHTQCAAETVESSVHPEVASTCPNSSQTCVLHKSSCTQTSEIVCRDCVKQQHAFVIVQHKLEEAGQMQSRLQNELVAEQERGNMFIDTTSELRTSKSRQEKELHEQVAFRVSRGARSSSAYLHNCYRRLQRRRRKQG